ncbi:hypothetical protein [Niveispirillum sp. KHB5.9]|uniref:hypothetical protein n=1 Tax=Niveispirillum sp. KHB5.9 TaxID=3400269 RepID=UPI003A854237
MTDRSAPPSDQPTPPPRGRLGQWSDRVKALLLLSLLAMAGAMAGLGGSGGEAERVRDGLSAGGSLRAALAEAPAVLSQGEREQARPDLSGGDAPAKALPDAVPALPPYPVAVAIIAAGPAGDVPHPRAGHAARMPTGPPAGLSA